MPNTPFILTLVLVSWLLPAAPGLAATVESDAVRETRVHVEARVAQRASGAKKRGKKRKKRPKKKARRKRVNPVEASAKLRRIKPNISRAEHRRGIVAPYSLKRIFRGFGKCRRGKHTHQAIDIGGVGEDAGLGTPIFAMARSKVTLIGRPEEDARQFGIPDLGKGTVNRGYKGRLVLPKQRRIPGYGKVTFFTKDYGSWRSGTVICTKVLEGRLKGHEVRYMHLGAVHPSLRRGTIVEAGEEIGLMGGTAILDSAPHVHIDITDTKDRRVDVAKLLGLPQAAKPCPPASSKSSRKRRRGKKNKKRR